jgi:hypothetical protein
MNPFRSKLLKQAARDEDAMFEKMKQYLERQGYKGRWYGGGTKTQTYVFSLDGPDRLVLWPPDYYATTGWDMMLNSEPDQEGDSLAGLIVRIQEYQESHGQGKTSAVDMAALYEKMITYLEKLGYRAREPDARQQSQATFYLNDEDDEDDKDEIWVYHGGWQFCTAYQQEIPQGNTYAGLVVAIGRYRETDGRLHFSKEAAGDQSQWHIYDKMTGYLRSRGYRAQHLETMDTYDLGSRCRILIFFPQDGVETTSWVLLREGEDPTNGTTYAEVVAAVSEYGADTL